MRDAKLRFNIRKKRIRNKISRLSDRLRLSVFKSGRHLYAQIIDDVNSNTIVSASTLDTNIRKLKKSNNNIACAELLGNLIVERAEKAGIKQVVFDKGGYKYHGVVKALADSARKGLDF